MDRVNFSLWWKLMMRTLSHANRLLLQVINYQDLNKIQNLICIYNKFFIR